MAENRDFAWLRRTLCEEIEAVRNGTADHNRAKSVAGLAVAALKSVEVEAMVRQQEVSLAGKNVPMLGSVALCAIEIPVFLTATPPEKEPVPAPEPAPKVDEPKPNHVSQPGKVVEHDITEVSGFKVGDRVFMPTGKRGTVKSVNTAGRINVEVDNDGGTFPYSAKHLSHVQVERAPITSPLVPTGLARMVHGKAASGSR